MPRRWWWYCSLGGLHTSSTATTWHVIHGVSSPWVLYIWISIAHWFSDICYYFLFMYAHDTIRYPSVCQSVSIPLRIHSLRDEEGKYNISYDEKINSNRRAAEIPSEDSALLHPLPRRYRMKMERKSLTWRRIWFVCLLPSVQSNLPVTSSIKSCARICCHLSTSSLVVDSSSVGGGCWW